MIALPASAGFTPPSPADFWQPLIGDGAFAVTRPMVVMVLTTAAICLVLVLATKKLSLVPSRGQWALEGVYGLVRNSVGRDIIGAARVRPYIGFLFAIFTLVLVNNLMGITPVVQYPTFSRIGFPIVLAIAVWLVYIAAHVRHNGVGGTLKHLVPPGLPFAAVPVVFVLELLTFLVIRPLTLALRLFGNMFAGHMLLLLFALGGEYMLLHGGFPLNVVALPTFLIYFFLTAFEILISFLQAYVFVLLTSLYIAEVYAGDH
ncbi:F0F1 ATP synthase subunit A [Quadrisphaera sp. INWT6]|uniref:F0F1 ATP synthase subunit A n=1 Tax=Quadrisphaera sp. INWT6 TaxID=2596917 RepID=UPI0018923E21|nr:F0F1 ATP synthase subunit A [Quadrisphaera sp. INWT6]MBF5080571.1 F0F1 ATP synthase subunit A [Quadrisphaera sp. INWT6]